MFKKLAEKLGGASQRIAGRTDILEACCASAALVAAADGDIDDGEVEAAIAAVKSNETLNQAFGDQAIMACMDKMLQKANGSFTGRAALMKEIGDIAKEDGETVFLVALDVAAADGDIDEKELAVLNKVGGQFGLNTSMYM